MTYVACESKLRSVVRSFIHQLPRNWVTIGCAVVYYARAAHAFSAGIKCGHCTLSSTMNSLMAWMHFGYCVTLLVCMYIYWLCQCIQNTIQLKQNIKILNNTENTEKHAGQTKANHRENMQDNIDMKNNASMHSNIVMSFNWA